MLLIRNAGIRLSAREILSKIDLDPALVHVETSSAGELLEYGHLRNDFGESRVHQLLRVKARNRRIPPDEAVAQVGEEQEDLYLLDSIDTLTHPDFVSEAPCRPSPTRKEDKIPIILPPFQRRDRLSNAMDKQSVIDATRRWISSVVIDLDLCPFAQRVFIADGIHYVATDADNAQALLTDLAREIEALAKAPIARVETTLLIHPHTSKDFCDYIAFLDRGDRLIGELGLRGTIQLASFHPDYHFADTEPDAVENYTNRSPYPMLHLLREASFAQLGNSPEALLDIPRRNGETLRRIGRGKILEMLKAVKDG